MNTYSAVQTVLRPCQPRVDASAPHWWSGNSLPVAPTQARAERWRQRTRRTRTEVSGTARSSSGSTRRDVSSVHSSAVDVRVSEVHIEVDVDVVVVRGADEDVAVEDVFVEHPYETPVPSSLPSTSFQCHEESCYTTSLPSQAFTSINEAKHQLKFLVPTALSGCIIGKNGSNLERIQALSGAFIQANAPGYAVHSNRVRFIIIAGDSMERCLHGLTLLLQSVKDANKLHLLKTNTHEDDPRLYLKQVIPGSCAGNIIGVKGGNVAKISRERGLSVFVEPKPLHATAVPFRIVSYAGSSVDQLIGGVQGVVNELQSVDACMEQYAAEIKGIKSVVIRVVRIPRGRVGALIGPKGSHLHALQEVLKCKMSIGKSEDDDAGVERDGDCYLTVWGQPENVRAAVSVAKLQGGSEVRTRPRGFK